MASTFFGVLRSHPEITFFLTLGIGYALGRLRYRSFAVGAVTGSLIAGVIVGQIGVQVSPDVKQCFFLLFLFSIGYRCGPQFFQGLRKDGLRQAAVAVVVTVTALLTAWGVSILFGFYPGTGAGLLAGSLTESAAIGTASDAISRLPLESSTRVALTNQIPVAFAVTYLIGVVGAAWFLSQIGPKLMGVDLAAACRDYEEKLGGGQKRDAPGIVSAYRRFDVRAYQVAAGSWFVGIPLHELNPRLRIFVERFRRNGSIFEADPTSVLQEGDIVAISGRHDLLVEEVQKALVEVEDAVLLDTPSETVDVFVTGKTVVGQSLRALSELPSARGIFLRRIVRNRIQVPLLPETTIQRGDIVTIVGSQRHVDAVVDLIGRADRPDDATDMVFVSAGIVVGALIGVPAIAIGNLKLGLSISVGVLLGGLVWGWFQSVRPTIGRIPGPTLWIFESIGLTGFVAVVGLAAGPDFVAGLRESGAALILAGVITTILPHLVGVIVGHRVLRLHPGIVLGVCAGAGTATPALAAVQEVAKSSIPTLGYGVAYAVGNVLLAIGGTLIVMLLN